MRYTRDLFQTATDREFDTACWNLRTDGFIVEHQMGMSADGTPELCFLNVTGADEDHARALVGKETRIVTQPLQDLTDMIRAGFALRAVRSAIYVVRTTLPLAGQDDHPAQVADTVLTVGAWPAEIVSHVRFAAIEQDPHGRLHPASPPPGTTRYGPTIRTLVLMEDWVFGLVPDDKLDSTV